MQQALFAFLLLFVAVEAAKKGVSHKKHISTSIDAASFCPSNNDFYYHGVIESPLYPNNYPPNTKCYYYLQAEPGSVLNITFPKFDLESCCDFVTIYDGATINFPVLAQIGGPNSNTTKPASYYLTSTRYAVVIFESNPTIQKSGFQLLYNSTTSVSPCNRDIVLMINGMSQVGSQANFVKQLDFIANKLTPTWNIGADKVRAMINLQVDIDYAVIWAYEDVPTNAELTSTVLGLTDDVPNVLDNNGTDLECLLRYTYFSYGDFGEKNLEERYGIEQVAIVFIGDNANSDQDYYEALEFAHKTRTEYDAKVIIVGMGNNLDQTRLSKLAFANGFAFFAGYDNLSSLVSQINNAICSGLNSSCGP